MQLVLIRHTRIAAAEGLCYGRTDLAPAASLADEAAAVAGKLAGLPLAACYSSPLRRCRALADALGWAPLRQDTRLMELDFGLWEGRPWDTLPRHEVDAWSRDYVNAAPPQGESFAALQARALACVQEWRAAHGGAMVAAITHAGVIRALLAEALALPLADTFRFKLDCGGVTRIDFGGALPAVAYVNR